MIFLKINFIALTKNFTSSITQVEGSTPGDFGIPFLPSIKSEADRTKALAQELNQGRAAQMGILAIMIHEQLNNRPYVIFDLLGVNYNFNE
jgi:hypothetical protein